MSVVVLIFSRQIIMDNWDKYKCNPMVTPFASAFGQDSAATMHNCSSQVFHTQATPMMSSMTGIFGGLFDIGDDLIKGVNDASSALDSGNTFTTKVFSSFLQQLSNVGSTFQGLILKMQQMFSRLAATMLSIVYAMEQTFFALTGLKPMLHKVWDIIDP